ncbi:hypothetical protein Tco_0428308 [Tanacetum coccineum]
MCTWRRQMKVVPFLDAHLQIATDANKPNPSPIEDADLVAPHANTSCNPSLVKWNWDEVILIPNDDDEANVNESIALPVEDADVEPSLDAHLQIAPDVNKLNPSPVEDADLPSLDAHLQIAPHPNTFCNPSLVNWNRDEVILIPSDDDEANVNEPIALPVEDADVEVEPVYVQNRVSVNKISSLKEGKLEWRKMVKYGNLNHSKIQEKHTREKSSINEFSSSLFDQKHSVFPDISGKMTNTIVTTPVNVTGAPDTNIVANHAEKPEKFNGQKFKRRWNLLRKLRMERLNLGNSPTANIKGKGDVIHIWKRV